MAFLTVKNSPGKALVITTTHRIMNEDGTIEKILECTERCVIVRESYFFIQKEIRE